MENNNHTNENENLANQSVVATDNIDHANESMTNQNASADGGKKNKTMAGRIILLVCAVVICVGSVVLVSALNKKKEEATLETLRDCVATMMSTFDLDESDRAYQEICDTYNDMSERQRNKYTQNLQKCLLFNAKNASNVFRVSDESFATVHEYSIHNHKNAEKLAYVINLSETEHADFYEYIDAVLYMEKYVRECELKRNILYARSRLVDGINEIADQRKKSNPDYRRAKQSVEDSIIEFERKTLTEDEEFELYNNAKEWKVYVNSLCDGAAFNAQKFVDLALVVDGYDKSMDAMKSNVYADLQRIPDFEG